MATAKGKKSGINSPRVKAILMVFLLALIAIILLSVWKFNKEIKNGIVSSVPASSERKNEMKPLTAGQIQEALSKKAEGQTNSKPLTMEEIQKSLNAKAN